VSSLPTTTRVRHELKRRQLTVTRLQRLAPNMLRIVLGGEELAQFTSLGFDDHVKLFLPSAQDPTAPAMRDFTPRRFDPKAGELWIEFYLHEAGPAAAWAKQATVGQLLTVGGPRGSSILSLEGIDSHVLVGDETALPAIARRLEELPANTRALVLIESDGGSTGYPLQTKAVLETVSVVREAHNEVPGKEIIDTLRKLKFPTGQCFTWVATESRAARAIRRYLTDERGFDKHWIKAAGYWQRGVTGKHEVISDGE
jgi:NADPH-dependent ferric siderophore reductase